MTRIFSENRFTLFGMRSNPQTGFRFWGHAPFMPNKHSDSARCGHPPCQAW
ncbi:hypothetical protein GHC20_16610 [Brucella sp. 2280]|nr:hypothetical protein GHC20_16610 [Brucella sp. 2280]